MSEYNIYGVDASELKDKSLIDELWTHGWFLNSKPFGWIGVQTKETMMARHPGQEVKFVGWNEEDGVTRTLDDIAEIVSPELAAALMALQRKIHTVKG